MAFMTIRTARLGAAFAISAAILSGCSASSSRYGGSHHEMGAHSYNESASFSQKSRYGDMRSTETCGYDVVQCGWNVEWVAIPTWHQVQTRTPIIETAPTIISQPPVVVQEPCPEGTYPSSNGDTCLKPAPVVELPPEPPVVTHYPPIIHVPEYLPPKK